MMSHVLTNSAQGQAASSGRYRFETLPQPITATRTRLLLSAPAAADVGCAARLPSVRAAPAPTARPKNLRRSNSVNSMEHAFRNGDCVTRASRHQLVIYQLAEEQ